MTHPLRQGLEMAREYLKGEAQYELQSYVDAVLAPRGWERLKASEDLGPTSPLSLTMTRELKAELEQAASRMDVVLDTLAEEGMRAALETGWLPPRTVVNKAPSSKTVLQLDVSRELRERVQARIDTGELKERAGYRVTQSSIAISWMADQLGVRRPGEGTQPMLLQFVPRALVAHWESVAASRGVTLESVLEDGIRALRDGSWEFPRPVRAAKGAGVHVPGGDVRNLVVRVDTELLEFLDEQAPVLAKKHDRKVFPGTIALAILKDRLGEPKAE